jgi:hypothetical protein
MDKCTEIFPVSLATIVIIIFSGLSTTTFGQSEALDGNSRLVYENSNSLSDGTESTGVPVNKPPIIVVTSPIRGEIDQTVIINASISDPDGNITSIIWNQEDEFPPVNMNISQDKQSMSFIPTQNVTYVFSIEAIDNSASTTLKSVQVNIE